MDDFRFLQNPQTKKWVILDPRRASRPNVENKTEKICPFCPGIEKKADIAYRIGGVNDNPNWQVLVIANKYPLTPVHEIIIHSPDHHKNFDELPLGHIELILQTYRQRYNFHMNRAGLPAGRQVYIFHNHGAAAGESIPHPHGQITVAPKNMSLDIPPLDMSIYPKGIFFRKNKRDDVISSSHFYIYCPIFSQWPDEVWLAPHRKNKNFGEINDREITDLSFCLQRLIGIFDMRHGHEFPFNFYFYPGKNWYLRIIPRLKILGAFEIGSSVMVNTQNPKDTIAFIKEHFYEPDMYKIRIAQQADYWKSI